jgi:multidrug efflux system membrane fusion protein
MGTFAAARSTLEAGSFAGSCLRIAAALLLLQLAAACSKQVSGDPKSEDPRTKMSVPVAVGTAVDKPIPIQLRAIGNAQAFATVAVKAQVEGELLKVHFQEGQEVQKGDLLFTIDPSRYEAQARQAEANLARDRTQLQNARKQVDRYTSMASKGYVANEKYDQIMTDAAALEAVVKADEAALEKARLEVRFCTIRSPIDGVTGSLRVHQGNVIKANDNDKPLVVINQIRPIHVAFAIPERSLPEVKRHMGMRKLEVQATPPGDDGVVAVGELSFWENAVDTSTGTIQLKASFPNADKMLWPGQFVHVVLNLATQAHAVVVPSQAIQAGQEGPFLFVVKPDSTVEYRPVVKGRTLDGETVIDDGLTPGETVVIDGQLRLAAGSLVKIVQSDRKM